MPNAISFEYLQSITGSRNGLATLDKNGTLTTSQLPPNAHNPFLGTFSTIDSLPINCNLQGIYAYVRETRSFWYYNWLLKSPAWVNQNITDLAYMTLSAKAKSAVPYIII